MYLRIDESTDFELIINRANRSAKSWDDKWCEVSLRIENEYFKYKTNNNELLLESELEELILALDKLLKGKLEKDSYIDFIEPDLEFKLIPLNKSENCLVDMKINLFLSGGLSADYYNLCLGKEEIKEILVYLNTIMPVMEINNKCKEEKFCIVSVSYDDYSGDKTYAYKLEENVKDTQIGDTVIVDRAGEGVRATIVEKGFYNEDNAPYPIKLTKKVIKVLKTPEEYKRYEKGKNRKYKCPCCGYYTLDNVGAYEICPVCYWKDDLMQSDKRDYSGGANKVSLNKAIENYIEFKASDKEFERKVRYPLLSETKYYGIYKDEEDICDVLYSGNKEQILDIIKELEIEYSFHKDICEFSININKIGILMRGKGRIDPKYNCIKYFGYKYSYKNLIKKCPNCNKDLVDILYGLPTGEAFEKAERKKLFLGGCVKFIGLEQPQYHCYNCNRNYCKDLINYEEVEENVKDNNVEIPEFLKKKNEGIKDVK